jgi:Holliday junction DNA helicase RuvA
MIAGLRGRLDAKLVDAVLVDVGGVLFRANTSGTTLTALGEVGETVRLQTHLYVREDQLALYGFASGEELKLFETLIGVTGVGPRLACAILSKFSPEALHEAIARENTDLLATVPGIGKKTAARLILELRGKLVSTGGAAAPPAAREDAEVVEALRSLGYTTAEAHAALAGLPRERDMAVEERVVAALRQLGAG